MLIGSVGPFNELVMQIYLFPWGLNIMWQRPISLWCCISSKCTGNLVCLHTTLKSLKYCKIFNIDHFDSKLVKILKKGHYHPNQRSGLTENWFNWVLATLRLKTHSCVLPYWQIWKNNCLTDAKTALPSPSRGELVCSKRVQTISAPEQICPPSGHKAPCPSVIKSDSINERHLTHWQFMKYLRDIQIQLFSPAQEPCKTEFLCSLFSPSGSLHHLRSQMWPARSLRSSPCRSDWTGC